ncbi:MAG: RNA 2',3'-cyclic phosphodiesterase [Gammaproteobacteria bacterium]|nr:RNA 2',3'-cyclic phosphodiesterase [Gammaproteobacteria bacterium]
MNKRRLFFALWPPSSVVRAVKQTIKQLYPEGLPGSMVKPDNYHLTLQFLGPVNQQQFDCACQQAERVQFTPFHLTLEQSGYWQGPRVAWLAPAEVPVALETMVKQLQEGLADCGFEAMHPAYRPHLTIARKVQYLQAQSCSPISWPVEEFALVESHTWPEGVQYKVIGRWPASQD